MKLIDIYDNFEAIKLPILSQQTMRTYNGYFFNHISPILGDRDIQSIKFIDYQKLVNDLLTVGLKPKTVKNILMLLSAIYRFARLNGWYEGDDIIKLVELPKFDNKRYFTLSKDLQKAYIKAILEFNEPIYKDIFLFLLHGRRLSEVLNIKWEYIDLSNEMYYLPAKVNKSKKNLSFKMTDKLVKSLRYYQKQAIDEQNTPFITGFVFKNPNTGLPFSDIRRAWVRLLKFANLPKMRLHDIRHLIGTYSINELNLSVEMVSHTLGHSDITITQRYINPKPENSKTVISSLFDSVEKCEFIEELDNDFSIADTTKKLHTLLAKSCGGSYKVAVS